jgi:hypothetical protein
MASEACPVCFLILNVEMPALGPISQVLEPIAHRPEDDKEVFTQEGFGLTLCCSMSASDAAHRHSDQRAGGRVWEVPGPVRDRERGKTPR